MEEWEDLDLLMIFDVGGKGQLLREGLHGMHA